jgi:hypothetical protein
MLLSVAQANFLLHGAVSPDMKKHVRPPLPDEPPDPDWKPLPQGMKIVAATREARDLSRELGLGDRSSQEGEAHDRG